MGAIIINNGADTAQRLEDFSDMIVFSSYAMQLIAAFMMLILIFMVLPRAMVASKRIAEVIAVKPSITDGNVTESSPDNEGKISFRNVSFRYPGASQDSLVDISFDVDKGETLAIIGSTGSGKTTLVKMIPRFFDAESGQVLVDLTSTLGP